MADYGRTYHDARRRIVDLVRDRDDADLTTLAPATPEWCVRDVVSHLGGVCADILAGNLAGVATDAWTAEQVDARRGRPFAEVLREWEETGPAVEELFVGFPELAAQQMLADAATHEHDIRGALDAAGARDDDVVAIGFTFLSRGVAAPLRFETDAGTCAAPPDTGDTEAVATVRASRFELFRAMTGRRSLDQIRAYEWDGAPRPEAIVVAPVFTARSTALVE